MKKDKNLAIKIAIYTLGLFLYSLGISISAKADLGIAPVSTLPYALSFILPFSFGITTFFMTVIYILIQMGIYGKSFEKRQYLQIIVGVLFSSFIDLTMLLLKNLNFVSYSSRLIGLTIGSFVLAIGIVLSVIPDLIIPPAEGAIAAIAKKYNKEFSNIKIIFDSTIVVLSIIVSLIFLGRLEGFKEGTIISVFLTGFFTKVLFKTLGEKAKQFINR